MKTGTILKGIGGYYTVQYEENKRCVLRPRGKFRHKEERPLPGDRVRFDVPPPGTEGFFEEILPRKNQMLRPAVANVDEVWAVICMQKPAGDFLLLDKLLANCRTLGFHPYRRGNGSVDKGIFAKDHLLVGAKRSGKD